MPQFQKTEDTNEFQPSLFNEPPHSATGVTPTKDKRWRGQFKFWLNANDVGEKALGDSLVMLKSNRQFAPTIRNALRLFLDLKAGNTEVLCELFPGIVTAISQPALVPSDEFNAIIAKIDALGGRLEHVTAAAHTGNAKALTVPNFTLPNFDVDDLDTLIIAPDNTKSSSAQNFIDGLLRL